MLANTRPYLGALELAVLEQLWSQGALEAKAVHRAIGTRRGIGLNSCKTGTQWGCHNQWCIVPARHERDHAESWIIPNDRLGVSES